MEVIIYFNFSYVYFLVSTLNHQYDPARRSSLKTRIDSLILEALMPDTVSSYSVTWVFQKTLILKKFLKPGIS